MLWGSSHSSSVIDSERGRVADLQLRGLLKQV